MKKVSLKTAGFFLFAALALSFFASQKGSSSTTYEIKLDDNGFHPSEMSIKKGDKVNFVNQRSEPFWPASNPHPIHDIYSEFDAGQPIPARGEWSFIFDKDGVFRYHDHLAVSFSGTITVGNGSAMSDAQNREMEFVETLKTVGVAAGFKLFEDLAGRYPAECHQYAHDLGSYAFEAHFRGEKFEISSVASACEYGFWHGFMAKMIETEDFGKAREFCESLTADTAKLASALQINCFHGVGIGLIADPPDPKFWGKSPLLAQSVLAYCDDLGETRDQQSCYSGVFHAVVQMMREKQHLPDLDPQEPFALCFAQAEKYRPECFFQIAPHLAFVTERDLPLTFQLLKQIPDAESFKNASMIALINFVDQKKSDHADFLKQCLGAGPELASQCIPALMNSFFSSAAADEAYGKGLALCRGGKLDGNMHSACFAELVESSRRFYNDEKMQEICADLKKDYSQACDNI